MLFLGLLLIELHIIGAISVIGVINLSVDIVYINYACSFSLSLHLYYLSHPLKLI